MDQEFRTKDLYLAAFLYSENKLLKRTDREGKICWFVFDNENDCREFVNRFWAGQAYCNAKKFADALRTLKDRIFSE